MHSSEHGLWSPTQLATPDIRQQAQTFPFLPNRVLHHTTTPSSRPPDQKSLHTTPKGEPTITQIELIFCKDTDHQPRLNKATTQHKH